jgi:hypothetical protein
MFNVSMNIGDVTQGEASTWAQELANIYADMEIDNIKMSGNKIFSAGMDDTQPDDINMRIEQYLTMNEIFSVDPAIIIVPV